VLECFLRDPEARLDAVMTATDNFGTVVVYTPPGRPGVCFEPWTCPPNVFNLAAQGVSPSGLAVLAPGEEWEGLMSLSLRASETGGDAAT
jgi:aldose 1-epimerase